MDTIRAGFEGAHRAPRSRSLAEPKAVWPLSVRIWGRATRAPEPRRSGTQGRTDAAKSDSRARSARPTNARSGTNASRMVVGGNRTRYSRARASTTAATCAHAGWSAVMGAKCSAPAISTSDARSPAACAASR